MNVARPVLAAAVTMLAACSSIDVSVDYDARTDFLRDKTWAWVPEGPRGTDPEAHPYRRDPLLIERARTAVQAALTAKGYRMVALEKAAFQVAVHATIQRRVEWDPPIWGGWAYGWGPYGDGPWWGPPDVTTIRMATLVVDILEPKPRLRVVWRGTGELEMPRDVSPGEREARVAEAVKKILASFPPSPEDPRRAS